MTKPLQQTIHRGYQYLIDSQKRDGSWNGPLSSRIRETLLVNEVSRLYGWEELQQYSSVWLESNRDLGDSDTEKLLNRAMLSIYKQAPLELIHPDLYDKVIVRKTLLIYCLALINNIQVEVPDPYTSPLNIFQFISMYLQKLQGQIKGWALAEMLCFKVIIGKHINIDVKNEVAQLLELKTGKGNWLQNPATTAMSLIALQVAGKKIAPKPFEKYFARIQQQDGGWSYCAIPLWDTGLSLESLYLADKNDKTIPKALDYIESHQNPDGGWGFDEGLESEADTSSILLYALRNSGRKAMLKKAVNYYKKLQFKDGEFAGLWPVWRQSEAPSLEVVSHIVSALQGCKADIDCTKALTWIAKQVESGNWKADWGRNLPYAINSITQATRKDFPELIKYLNDSQNSDGGWGATKGEKSNASATANAIMTFKWLNKAKYAKEIEDGTQYLCSTQAESGTWPRVKEVIGPRPFVYADDSSTHNFVIQALLI
ncbi:MAG: hypothetical protein JNK26_02355 [Candidatus Doudnabacteria bacterium]|nr:hypothetical protein [Candidatus Doudnabacteria bacterium]